MTSPATGIRFTIADVVGKDRRRQPLVELCELPTRQVSKYGGRSDGGVDETSYGPVGPVGRMRLVEILLS